MRKQCNGSYVVVWLSANDTYEWARSWPCSTLSGKRLRVELDAVTGDIVDIAVNGQAPSDIDSHELDAMLDDMIGARSCTS